MSLLHLAVRDLSRRQHVAAMTCAQLAHCGQSSVLLAVGDATGAAAPAQQHLAAAAAASGDCFRSRQCGARGFATETAADKFELFSPEAGLTHVEGYTDDGFLVNDVTLQGGLLALRNSFYAWDARAMDLSAVALLSPLPEVLVFGSGPSIRPPPSELMRSLQSQGVGLEVSDTVNAIATFNILAQEGRHVAGAFVPMADETQQHGQEPA